MPRTPQDVTDAELAVLRVLWERGPATRRQLADALYPGGAPSHYTTVQKLLERLEDKGYVKGRRGAGGARTFAASVDRDELINRRLRDVAAKLCDGSLAPLLMNLVQTGPLSAREVDELRAFLDEQTRGRR